GHLQTRPHPGGGRNSRAAQDRTHLPLPLATTAPGRSHPMGRAAPDVLGKTIRQPGRLSSRNETQRRKTCPPKRKAKTLNCSCTAPWKRHPKESLTPGPTRNRCSNGSALPTNFERFS